MNQKYTITLPGKPHLYNPTPTPGWEVCGEIKREGELTAGALIRNTNTGLYAQANAGAIRNLYQREVARALAATVNLEEAKTGAPYAKNRIQWAETDWSKSDTELAREYNTTRQNVRQRRLCHTPKP